MEIASRQPMWNARKRGTVIEVRMTPATGLTYRVAYQATADRPLVIEWGDGTKTESPWSEGDQIREHTYGMYGRYEIAVFGVKSIGIRFLDGQARHSCDAAVISVVDYCGQIVRSQSAGFKNAVNLERYICPNCKWQGQRDFANCTKLREIAIGENAYCFDGTYQNCTALAKYTTKRTGICWSCVWQGCTKLKELHLGTVKQFATDDFDRCPNLMDIWIDGKTVEQIKQTAASGNIIAGYGAKFPWKANPACRFHGTNGVVLGNGSIIHS